MAPPRNLLSASRVCSNHCVLADFDPPSRGGVDSSWYGGPRERVGALVVDVSGMTADPSPLHLVDGHCGIERAPEIVVAHRFLVRSLPAVRLPALQPLRCTVHDIAGIGVDSDLRSRFERV